MSRSSTGRGGGGRRALGGGLVVVADLSAVHGRLLRRVLHRADVNGTVRDPVVCRLHAGHHLHSATVLLYYYDYTIILQSTTSRACMHMTMRHTGQAGRCNRSPPRHRLGPAAPIASSAAPNAVPCTTGKVRLVRACNVNKCAVRAVCARGRTVHSRWAMALCSTGLPLVAVMVSTPSKRSAPGGKRFRKCFITGADSSWPSTLSTNVSPTCTAPHPQRQPHAGLRSHTR